MIKTNGRQAKRQDKFVYKIINYQYCFAITLDNSWFFRITLKNHETQFEQINMLRFIPIISLFE